MAGERSISRIGVLVTVASLLLGLLTVRLWFLQAIDAPGLEEKVREVRTRTIKLTPERGRIFDLEGRIVASNERILTITIERAVIAKPLARSQMWARLSGALNMTVAELEDRYDQLQPLPLKEDVAEDLGIYLRERSEDYPGLDVREEWRREYPYAPMASHVIGFLGAIKKGSEQEYYKNLGYDPDARVGQFGVEQTYEAVLRGTPGYVK